MLDFGVIGVIGGEKYMSDLLVGIDLGTSNCAVAYVDPSRGTGSPILDFPVTQLRRLGDVAPQPLLPSCIYLPGEHELPAVAIALPWDPAPQHVIGEFARW